MNPGREVLASVRPTMATMRNARMVLSSSPFGMLDAHYDAYELGDTRHQVTAYAPTWEANPTLSEEWTRDDEPDEQVWLRECKAIPQAEVESSLLSEVLIDDARRHPPQCWDLPFEKGRRYVATMDPATRTNAWTLVVATQTYDRKRRIVLAREWRPKKGLRLSSREVLKEIKTLIAPYGLRTVYSDQHAADQLAELGQIEGLSIIEEPWTLQTKESAYKHLKHLLQSDMIELHPDPIVKTDLLGIRKVITRMGQRIELVEQRGRHSDYAPALAMAVDDIRWRRGDAPSEEDDVEGAQASRKREFLLAREKARREEERRGRMPITHRNQPIDRLSGLIHQALVPKTRRR